MLYKKIIQKALKCQLKWENNPSPPPDHSTIGQDKEISLLIYDIFGGEILKTSRKKEWHFYNRIDGERIDFSETTSKKRRFEDIISTPEEAHLYFGYIDYYSFYMTFVRKFEEIVGLKGIRTGSLRRLRTFYHGGGSFSRNRLAQFVN
jgi:hypothetical protein